MKNALFFHRVDWDGLLSAAIVLNENSEDIFDLFPINYGDKLPSLEELEVYDTIYVVDYSLPREYNQELGDRLIWIDHHISAIKANEDLIIRGLQDTTFSACELCWIYFNGPYKIHMIVNLLGEYDIFEKSERYFSWEDILTFQMGARTIDLTIENAKKLLTGEISASHVMDAGKAILTYARQQEKTAFERMAWDVTIDGHPAKALLANEMSSLMCEQTLATHIADVVVLINRRNDNEFKISVRVADGCDFDASEFCKKFGGGGHRPAAGCTIPIETFIELYTKHSI